MNLTFEAFLQYALAGDLTLSLRPEALRDTYDSGERAEKLRVAMMADRKLRCWGNDGNGEGRTTPPEEFR